MVAAASAAHPTPRSAVRPIRHSASATIPIATGVTPYRTQDVWGSEPNRTYAQARPRTIAAAGRMNSVPARISAGHPARS